MKASHQIPLRCIENRQIFQDNSSEYFSVISCSFPYMINTKYCHFCADDFRQIPTCEEKCLSYYITVFFLTKGMIPEQDVAHGMMSKALWGVNPLIRSSRSWLVCWMNGHCKQQVLISWASIPWSTASLCSWSSPQILIANFQIYHHCSLCVENPHD